VTQPPFGESRGYYEQQYAGQPSYPQQYPPPPQYSTPNGPYPPPVSQPPPYGGPAAYSTQPPYGQPPWPGGPPPTGYPGGPESSLSQLGKPRRNLFSNAKAIGSGILGLGIIVFIVYAFFLGSGPGAVGDAVEDATDDEVPEVGECITEESLTAEETTVVPCDGSEAAWLTLGFDGEVRDTEFRFDDAEDYCQEFPTTGFVLWIGELGGWGDVVCLVEVTTE
jgi:hypothetical protein